MDNITKIAEEYHRADGFNVIPLQPERKTPAIKDLKKHYLVKQSDKDVINLFPAGSNQNIGVSCGTVSDNLVILDFDSKAEYLRCLERQKWQSVLNRTRILRSRRGYHVYLKLKEDRPLQTTHKSKILDIQGYKSYCVTSPSRVQHEGTSYPYLWESLNTPQNGRIFEITLDHLNSLVSPVTGSQLNLVSKDELQADLKPYTRDFFPLYGSGLGKKAVSILLHSEYALYGYGSQSEADMSVIIKALSCGFTDEQVKRFFYVYSADLKRKRNADNYLKNSIDNAKIYLREHLKEHDRLVNDYTTLTLSSGLKPNTKAVLLGILQITRNAGRFDDLSISVRELVLSTGLGLMTVQRHLEKLVESGLILKNSYDIQNTNSYTISGEFANIISLFHNGTYHHTGGVDGMYGYGTNSTCVPVESIPVDNDILDPVQTLSVNKQVSEDIYRHSGIGKTGYLMVDYLNSNLNIQYSISDLYRVLKISKQTLKRKIQLLIEFDLIKSIKVSDSRFKFYIDSKITIDSLHPLSQSLGVEGKGEEVRKRIEQERQIHKEKYKRYRESVSESQIQQAILNRGEITA